MTASQIDNIKSHKSGSIWTHLAALLAVTAWGVSFVNTRVLLDNGFNPVEVYLCRSILAYLMLLLLSRKRPSLPRTLRHELLFVLCGLCGGSIYFVSENMALVFTSTTNVSLITSTTPLITALLVGLLYRDERPGFGLIIGSLIALAGVCMVVLDGSNAESSYSATQNGTLGNMLAVMSAICWSVYSIIIRRLTPFYSAIYITRKTFFYGLITALPFLCMEPSHLSPEAFTLPTVWINLLLLSLFSSSFAFVIWAYVVNKIGAVKAGNYCYFQPIATLIFSAIVLHEMCGLWGIAGCIVTILGVYAGEKIPLMRRFRK